MKLRVLLSIIGLAVLAAPQATPAFAQAGSLGNPAALNEKAPATYKAKFDTSKGVFVIEVRRELVITAGDASAITLTFNGADARLLGKSGEVVTARFNLNNFKSYLQAR